MWKLFVILLQTVFVLKKPASIHLAIPQPCTRKWDEMIPVKNGRFCNSCQNTVFDFTSYSDKQLYEFFANYKGHICGKLHTWQLGRAINIPPQPSSNLYRIFIGLGLSLLFVQAPEANARKCVPYIEQNLFEHIEKDSNESEDELHITIKGKVTDADGNIVVHSRVAVQNAKRQKVLALDTTDVMGTFDITVSADKIGKKGIVLVVTADRFEIAIIPIKRDDIQSEIIIKLEDVNTTMLGMMEITPYKVPLMNRYEPNKTIITSDQIEKMAR